MKQIIFKAILLATMFFAIITAQAAPKSYILDPTHTYVEFHINHFGFSNPSGKWMAQGKLELDDTKIQNSSVNVTIDVAKVSTGNPELDKHLIGAEFFDTTKFPTATFVSHSINRSGKESAIINGTLTVHGISKPVTFKVKLNKKGKNPINNKATLGFTANTTLQRSDYGIRTLLPGLGNEVTLRIEAEANQAD